MIPKTTAIAAIGLASRAAFGPGKALGFDLVLPGAMATKKIDIVRISIAASPYLLSTLKTPTDWHVVTWKMYGQTPQSSK
jgi:hypothetical protein